jgi:hypothetical protein
MRRRGEVQPVDDFRECGGELGHGEIIRDLLGIVK